MRDGRLEAHYVAGRYLIPETALAVFRTKPHGRIRTKPAQWRHYATSTVYVRHIDAPIRPGCETALTERIATMADSGAHCIPGTMARYIWTAGSVLSVVLIWKSTEATPEGIEQAMAAFREALEGFVEWERATDSTSEATAHT